MDVPAAVEEHRTSTGLSNVKIAMWAFLASDCLPFGALIGIAACMIALKGTTPVEDVFLNLGGMFAAVVAIVPTSRGVDHRTAVRACEQADTPLLTEKASTDPAASPLVDGLIRRGRSPGTRHRRDPRTLPTSTFPRRDRRAGPLPPGHDRDRTHVLTRQTRANANTGTGAAASRTAAAAWPGRAGDPFADRMNTIPKYVVSAPACRCVSTAPLDDRSPTTRTA